MRDERTGATVVDVEGGEGTVISTLTASADSYLRRGAKNRNEGGATFLRLKASGDNRALVGFDPGQIAALGPGPVERAVLELYIERNRNNWGPSGRTVDLHRLTAAWSEFGACPSRRIHSATDSRVRHVDREACGLG